MDVATLKVVAKAMKDTIATFEDRGDETSQMAVKLTAMMLAAEINKCDQSLHPVHFMRICGLSNVEALEFANVINPDWWNTLPLDQNRFE